MNILIPHSWLTEQLKTKATPEDIQKFVSLSGPSIERIHTIGDEPVYDVEVTTNRMDTACVRGIAREATVILPQNGFKSSLKDPAFYTPKNKDITHDPAALPIHIKNDDKLCSRIMCVFMDVK